MHLARWWVSKEDQTVQCQLCPRRCVIADGQVGTCRVRKNSGGRLYSLVYGHPIAVHIDPIEKKPLYHFQPGSRVFSLGTVGCNLQCIYCQNWDISTASAQEYRRAPLTPQEIVQQAHANKCQSIAFTYNEPTIFSEYVLDIAQAARAAQLKTVMVTNAYINPPAVADIYPYIDAANIDLKAFTNDYYRKMCGGNLAPVLEAIEAIKAEGTWIELTTLLIPGLNDGEDEIRNLVHWVREHLGVDTPLHFTAFHPDYRLLDRPATPKKTLDTAWRIAREMGMHYVYEGNVVTGTEGNTYCPQCGRLLIERYYYQTHIRDMQEGRCVCGQDIPIIW